MSASVSETPSSETPASGSIRSLKPILRYLRPYRWQIVCALLALLFTSSAVLGLGGALRYLVDEGIGKNNPALLDRALWGLLAVVLLLAAATYARYLLVSSVGEKVIADIRRDVYRHLLRMDIGFFESARTGELLSRLTADTTLLQSVVGSSVSVALRNSLMLAGGLTLLALTSARLTGYVLLLVPVVVTPIIIFGKRVRALSRETQNRLADMSSLAEESLGGIRTIQAMSLEARETAKFESGVKAIHDTALQKIRLRAILTALVIGLVFGAIILVLWFGGHDVLNGRITAGDLSAFIFYSVVVAGAVGALSEVTGELQRAGGATDRLMELLSYRSRVTAPEHPTPMPSTVTGRISFEHITFHYPSRPDKSALHDFSLDILPGETVALVGPSGAGKSTVLQLLLRYYDPQSGVVRIDGTDIRSFDPVAMRGVMGLVPQDPVIFSGNGWDNIRAGHPEASDAEVREAARAAAALEFLERLPEGLNTYLGEKGIRLSGGQKQRIAIARAMIRNPAILLLDEATSALDAENEKLVQGAIERLMEGRTTLVIAHRLATVLRADRIVVLDHGTIEAIGTHQQLLTDSPLYARLAALQFSS